MGAQRRLPDGNTTSSASVYGDAWRSLAQPLLDETRWELLGFDPGFLFDAGNRAVSLSVQEVRLLSRVLTERDEALAHLHGRPVRQRAHQLAGTDTSAACCERWEALRETFRWFVDTASQTRAMPCLVDANGEFVRIQFCPSCGAPRRDATWPLATTTRRHAR